MTTKAPAFARYVPHGVAAVAPPALAIPFPIAPPRANRNAGSAVVVFIDGPLTHQSQPQGFDTYAAIADRFQQALAAGPAAIILSINSPGGDVSGSFDLSRTMCRQAAAAGIPLIAHSESTCASAGYALACAASRIVCSDTATLGSIGCITQVVDVTAADAAMGMRFAVISSGERKADGNPHVALSPEARNAIEQSIDAMAAVFFEHVGKCRPRLSAASAKAMQAGVLIGHAAVAAGLADDVMSLPELIESLNQ